MALRHFWTSFLYTIFIVSNLLGSFKNWSCCPSTSLPFKIILADCTFKKLQYHKRTKFFFSNSNSRTANQCLCYLNWYSKMEWVLMDLAIQKKKIKITDKKTKAKQKSELIHIQYPVGRSIDKRTFSTICSDAIVWPYILIT